MAEGEVTGEVEGKPGHARLSASEAKRWMACPGSVALSAASGKEGGSRYADLGTAAHRLAADCLLAGADAAAYLGNNILVGRDGATSWTAEAASGFNAFAVDAEMAEAVQVYLDECREIVRSLRPDVKCWVERRLRGPRPDTFGTADFMALRHFDVLHVVDYKHGAGVGVEVQDNEQLLCYALYAAEDCGWAFDRVEVAIVQPRCPHSDGPVRRTAVTADELRAFRERLLGAAAATDVAGAPLSAGEHCRFCPAAAGCPELHGLAARTAVEDFEGIPVDASSWGKDAVALSDRLTRVDGQGLAARMLLLPALDAFARAVVGESLRRMSLCQDVPGFKLVAKRGKRAWREGAEEELRAWLGDHALEEPSVKSPAQVEKTVRIPGLTVREIRERVATLCEKRSGGVTVVPEADPREAVDPMAAVADDFAEEPRGLGEGGEA